MKRISVLVVSSVLLAFSGSDVDAAKVESRSGCVNLQTELLVNTGGIQCLPTEANIAPYRLLPPELFVWKKGWMIMTDCIYITGFKSTCTDAGSVSALTNQQVIAKTTSTSIKQVGSAECSGIRGDNANIRPIQKATLEPLRRGYILRFTEINQGKPIETVWELDQGLIIESARTGTGPQDQWNLTSYNRQPPVAINPAGKFSISMMVSSRSVCTFAGTLQFLSDAKSNLFPASSPSSQQRPKAASTRKIAEGRYWVGAMGMVIEVKGKQYQFRDEETETDWRPISELTYIKDGVFKTGETYWCLSTMPHQQLAVCSEKGWVRSK